MSVEDSRAFLTGGKMEDKGSEYTEESIWMVTERRRSASLSQIRYASSSSCNDLSKNTAFRIGGKTYWRRNSGLQEAAIPPSQFPKNAKRMRAMKVRWRAQVLP